MAKYALLLGGSATADLDGKVELASRVYKRYTAWLLELRQSGHKVQTLKLNDRSGARLSVHGGQVVEGPFVESREAVGGIVVLDAADLTEAIAIARRCPALELPSCTIEVRPLDEVGRPGPV